MPKLSLPDCSQLVVFFTGLSGSGKTTLSDLLVESFKSAGNSVTHIDGDVLRGMLSSDLGYSKADRELNLQRAAYVSGEVVAHGGTVVCAMIAPYQQARQQARDYIQSKGGRFIEVYLNTPLSICEARDPKGMYAKARRGEIQDFTGIDSPFEAPQSPDITINTAEQSEQACLQQLLEAINTIIKQNEIHSYTEQAK